MVNQQSQPVSREQVPRIAQILQILQIPGPGTQVKKMRTNRANGANRANRANCFTLPRGDGRVQRGKRGVSAMVRALSPASLFANITKGECESRASVRQRQSLAAIAVSSEKRLALAA